MITKLNPEVIQEGSITADKINIESLKTDSGFVTEDSLTNKIDGKGLSTEDFTTALKTKLEGLSNYDDTTLSNALSTLRSDFDKLVSGDTTTAIKTFNEVIAFLDGLTDTQNLESIIASIEQQIAGKMDKVTLATVATSGSYNDLSNKPTIPAAVTESNVSGWGFTKNTGTITQIKANGTSVATSGVANIPAASTSAYGVTKLSSATNSTSTTLAATASAVKAAYDLANGKQDKLVSGTNIKTINGTSILGSGDITIEGGSNEDTPLKFVFDEINYQYSIISTNDFGEYTWNLPSAGGNLAKSSDIMYKLEHYVVGYLPEIYACANGEIDSTLFDKSALGTDGLLPIVSTDASYVAGVVSGYNIDLDTDTITFSIFTYDGKCIIITTLISDENIYTGEIRIIDFVNLGGGSSSANVQAVDTGDVLDDVAVDYATIAYVDGLVGDINSVLESIISGGGTNAIMTITNGVSAIDIANTLINTYGTIGSLSNPNPINENIIFSGFTYGVTENQKCEYIYINSGLNTIYLYGADYSSTLYCVRISLVDNDPSYGLPQIFMYD